MRYVSVKNHEKFQHYKDRNPPWIKLYTELLDDYEFGRLQDASKMHLIGIWLLASKCENRIPFDEVWIAKRIQATDPVDVQTLVAAGFLIVEQSASDALARVAHVARPETEAERETSPTPPPPALVLSGGSHPVRPAVLGGEGVGRLLAMMPAGRNAAMCARFNGWLEGMGLAAGLRATVADIELGCQDLVDTAPASPPSPSTVRGFVEKCIRRRLAAEAAAQADRASPNGSGVISGAVSGSGAFAAAAQALWDRVTATMRGMPWRMIPRERFTEVEWRVIGAVGGLAALAEMDFGDLPHVQRRFIGAYCAAQTASALALSDSPTPAPEVLRA